ncbi:MAG: hypothetical protein IJE07_12330 [Clostridia bacterium]|nr:hypothetical protein [Clostridia bacterium]
MSETGEASPEITRLPLLAQTFGVMADWLLSEEEPEDAAPPPPEPEPQGRPCAPAGDVHVHAMPDWVDKLPGFLSRLIRRYGWLIGLRIAITGALFTALGFVARAMFFSMNSFASSQMNGMPGSSVTFYNNAGSVVDPGSLGLSAADLNALGLGGSGLTMSSALTDPFTILTTFIIGLGVILLVGGALLAWYLKRWGSEA